MFDGAFTKHTASMTINDLIFSQKKNKQMYCYHKQNTSLSRRLVYFLLTFIIFIKTGYLKNIKEINIPQIASPTEGFIVVETLLHIP